jgi:hypothetical protein
MLYGQTMQGQKELAPDWPCLWTLEHEATAPMAAEKTCYERAVKDILAVL